MVTDHPPKAGARWRVVARLLTAAALVYPVAKLLAYWDWRADLLTPFQEPALAVTLAAAGAQARLRRPIGPALALAALAAFQVVPLLAYSGRNPVPPDPDSPARLRILMANVEAGNPDPGRLERLIRLERPDVVGLVEVTDEYLAGLAGLHREYPHREEFPNGTIGLALWFRSPPRTVDRPEVLTPRGNPLLHATLDLGGRPRHLWLVHPPNPVGPRGRRICNPELAALAARIGEADGSKLMVGDLNRTDGSHHFRDFLRRSGLRDSRLGFGRQPSWPTWSPYRIAIDHAFLTGDLAVIARRVGPDIGSDHYPLILDIAPASDPTSATKAASQSSGSSP